MAPTGGGSRWKPPKAKRPPAKSTADLLPYRPFQEKDGEYCQIPGARFSFVNRKHLADMTVPPTQLKRCFTAPNLATGTSQPSSSKPQRLRGPPSMNYDVTAGAGTAKKINGIASLSLNACQGDFCNAKVNYPASLQDLETSEHPWMLQARQLRQRCCKDSEGREGTQPLLTSEEMAACLQISGDGEAGKPAPMACVAGARFGVPEEKLGSVVSFGSAGDIQVSWIFEGRAYPRLCSWLQEANWMLDANDAAKVAEAAKCFHEDEAATGGKPVFKVNGMLTAVRQRLRTVPVCSTCFCVYNTLHAVIVMMTYQRRDRWARNELRLKKDLEERTKKEELERLLFYEKRGDGSHFNVASGRPWSAGVAERTAALRPQSPPKHVADKAVMDKLLNKTTSMRSSFMLHQSLSFGEAVPLKKMDSTPSDSDTHYTKGMRGLMGSL